MDLNCRIANSLGSSLDPDSWKSVCFQPIAANMSFGF